MKKVTVLAVFFGVTALICAVQASVAYVVNSGIYYRGDFIDDPVLILLPGQQGAIEKSFVRDGVDQAYRLTFTVKPIDQASIHISADLELAGDSLPVSRSLKLGQPEQARQGALELDLLVEQSLSE